MAAGRSLRRLIPPNLLHPRLPPVVIIRRNLYCLRSRPLLEAFVARVALDYGDSSAILFGSDRQAHVADFDIMGERAEVLMDVVLADGVLILDDVVGEEAGGGEFGGVSFFELVESAGEDVDEHGVDAIFFCEQVEFFDDVGDAHSQPCFVNEVLHDV